MQRIHVDIVGPLPRSRSGKRYFQTVQCSFTKWAEAFAFVGEELGVSIWCARQHTQ